MDILHAIGLSIIVCALLVVGRRAAVARAVSLAVVATVVQPILAAGLYWFLSRALA